MNRQELLTDRNEFKGSFLPYTSFKNRKWDMVDNDVWVYTNRIVNICIIQNERKELIMVDAGMPKDYKVILNDIRKMYGGRKPIAIILTHGHFDHVGSLAQLLAEWNIPVYAGTEELPYLNGMEDYPEGEFSWKGMVAMLSKTFPNKGINISQYLFPLPENHAVPYLADWEWIATPGHTPGHVSFYNRKKGILIAGDAVVTVKQESFLSVVTQRYRLNGPPAYFTPNKKEAKRSIMRLLDLSVRHLITGHGPVIHGDNRIESDLKNLLKQYDEHG